MRPLIHNIKKHGWLLGLPVFLIVMTVVVVVHAPHPEAASSEPQEEITSTAVHTPTMVHIALPSEVRGFYWTATTAGSARAQELLAYLKEYGLNTVVIDLKMDDGELAFAPQDDFLKLYGQPRPAIADLDALTTMLADEGVYRIARIAVMRDGAFARVHPELAMRTAGGELWKDKIGSLWLDPTALQVADYAIALGREAYARGFDEVQFDYVRFASDGAVNRIVYPVYDGKTSMTQIMQTFFARVGGAMQADQIPVSFDLFGMTFWSYRDFNIGQRLVDALPYADWVSPMVYPSHYPDGFEGFANPAEAPYEIVRRSLDEGTRLTHGFWSGSDEQLRAKWRPWLQDFDIGAVYTSDKIEAQIKAARDAGASGWILWNARNVYEPAQYK
ncbi:hypothetical protein HZA85_00945 [Candidatus Uhrbacteria bacterium]|nr:hypothetical protein [Candidatus Uhrbacteria bacterium]